MNAIRAIALATLLGGAVPVAGHAAVLTLPAGAEITADDEAPAGRYEMPVGPWTEDGGIPKKAFTGKITRQAWRLGGTGLSSFQILNELKDQLTAAGYKVLLECDAKSCGGFDFRYGTDVIEEPAMHVDLGDYHFLSAAKPGRDDDAVSLMVSRSASAGFVQMVEVGAMEALPAAEPPPEVSTKANPGSALPAAITGDIGPALEQVGRYVLGDLVFDTGSSDLGPGPFSSLDALAGYLKAHPKARIALVGHTDAQGSLSGNIALSKRRAESVMARLTGTYGVPAAQLEADGVGYLSPLASNQTEAGRTQNRRVEAILVSTE